MGLRDWADREIAQGADFEPSGDPEADRETSLRIVAGVVGHQVAEYRQGLERDEDFTLASAAAEANRFYGERMAELGQNYDAARARKLQAAADVAERDDHEIDDGVDDDHRRHLGMGIG
jgi:hypothetical protein